MSDFEVLVRIRRPKWIAVWAIITIILATAAALAAHTEAMLALLLILVFVLQALISELLGVEVDADGLSFPNHPIAQLPIFTLWRTKISQRSFDRIDRLGSAGVVIFVAGAPVVLHLPSHEDQRAFLRYCSKIYPEKQIG